MNKFDYRWDNEAVGFHVTMNGNDLPNEFFKAKGKFDRWGAEQSTRSRVSELTYAEEYYQKEVVRPLTALEVEYLELEKKLYNPDSWNKCSEQEMNRALYLNQCGLMRDSVLRLTHPYVDGIDYLPRYSEPAWKARIA